MLGPRGRAGERRSHDRLPRRGQRRKLAKRRLAQAIERFGGLGIVVTGEVGVDHRPVDAVLDVLRRGEAIDHVIVSTLPIGVSRWVRLDAVSRIQRAVDQPVEHVVAEEARAGTR